MEDNFGKFKYFIYKTIIQKMRWIEPGTFIMGSPETETNRMNDETQHEVTLTEGFWLADTACTQELWTAVMGNNPSKFKDNPENPVEMVSWDDCQEFIKRINREILGLLFSLPTEAQWEYACRAGTTTPFSFGNNITTDQVNHYKKGGFRKKTVPVKTFPCNAWGLYEMHGNVWEWCKDWYGYYQRYPIVNPCFEAEYRVRRGGSWYSSAVNCRSAYRDCRFQSDSVDNLGFRFCAY